MAGLPTGAMSPQQQQAIAAAIQQAISQSGADTTYGNFDNIINQSVAGSGLFDPTQLAAIQAGAQNAAPNLGGDMQNARGGNSAAEMSSWTSNIDNALQPLLNQQAQTANQQLFQPNPNLPANQALAGGYNPLQPAYLQTPPTLNPTTMQASYYNPSGLDQGLLNSLGSQQTIAALQQSVAPQYQQQDQQLMQMLATSGLAPSSTAGQTAFDNLAQQQLAGISPAMAAAIQNSQGNQLNAGQYNAGVQNAAGQFNAGAANSASGYNATAQNDASGQNLQNLLAQQQYNANAYNGAGTNYFNALTGQYTNNANAYNALNSQGLSGSTGLAGTQAAGGNQLASGMQNNYAVYGGTGNAFSNLGSSLGQFQQPRAVNPGTVGTQTTTPGQMQTP